MMAVSKNRGNECSGRQKILKCYERSDDCSTGLNSTNGIIVYYSTCYRLFTNPHPLVCFTISRRMAEVRLRSQRPLRPLLLFTPTVSVESSGVVSQPIIMLPIGLTSHSVQQ
ncbi:hypothetical protein TNCV_206301 [Trichonephila clavipes]|nr:hypothetical protein TNCV_206301 [Trichonephila clavipes]